MNKLLAFFLNWLSWKPKKKIPVYTRGFEMIQIALILIIVIVAYGVISGLWEQIWNAVTDKLSEI